MEKNNTDFMFLLTVCFVCVFLVCYSVLQTKEKNCCNLYPSSHLKCFWLYQNPNTVHVYLRIILKHFKQVQNARALTHACPALAVCAARFYRARACSCRRTFVVETPCKAPCETKMKKKYWKKQWTSKV